MAPRMIGLGLHEMRSMSRPPIVVGIFIVFSFGNSGCHQSDRSFPSAELRAPSGDRSRDELRRLPNQLLVDLYSMKRSIDDHELKAEIRRRPILSAEEWAAIDRGGISIGMSKTAVRVLAGDLPASARHEILSEAGRLEVWSIGEVTVTIANDKVVMLRN